MFKDTIHLVSNESQSMTPRSSPVIRVLLQERGSFPTGVRWRPGPESVSRLKSMVE